MTFSDYLKAQDFSSSTIKGKLRYITHFETWRKQKRHTYPIDYKIALQYLSSLKQKNNKPKSINMMLVTLSQYMDYHIHHNTQDNNPFITLRVSGVSRNKLYTNTLSSEEIEDLYYSYPELKKGTKRQQLVYKQAKVILGLLCYQGLAVVDIKRLKVEHIHLQKGQIYVPSGRIGARRKLPLQAPQILALQDYIINIRPELLEHIEPSELLFPQPQTQIASSIKRLFKILKTINNKVKDAKHIRASVIIYWLSKYNLRQVQYMAGHRQIRATEHYRQDHLENLQQMIATLHPLS